MKRMIGFLVVVGLMMGVGCGSDDDNPVNSNRDLFGRDLVVSGSRCTDMVTNT